MCFKAGNCCCFFIHLFRCCVLMESHLDSSDSWRHVIHIRNGMHIVQATTHWGYIAVEIQFAIMMAKRPHIPSFSTLHISITVGHRKEYYNYFHPAALDSPPSSSSSRCNPLIRDLIYKSLEWGTE